MTDHRAAVADAPTDLVLGATSGIGKALARQLAHAGRRLIISGRDADELDRLGSDLRIRGAAEVIPLAIDARAFDAHAAFADAVHERAPRLQRIFVFTGLLGDMDAAKVDAARARALIDVNFAGVVSLLTPIAERLASSDEADRAVVVVGSVAGDRARGSNYPYGAAKAGLHAWTDGLRHALFARGVHVMRVAPGFVDTAMTYGKEGMFLVADPDDVAAAILRDLARRRRLIYVPWFWRWILAIVCRIPEPLFLRTKM